MDLLKLELTNALFHQVKSHLPGVKIDCQVLILLFMYLMLVHGMFLQMTTHVMLHNGELKFKLKIQLKMLF